MRVDASHIVAAGTWSAWLASQVSDSAPNRSLDLGEAAQRMRALADACAVIERRSGILALGRSGGACPEMTRPKSFAAEGGPAEWTGRFLEPVRSAQSESSLPMSA